MLVTYFRQFRKMGLNFWQASTAAYILVRFIEVVESRDMAFLARALKYENKDRCAGLRLCLADNRVWR